MLFLCVCVYLNVRMCARGLHVLAICCRRRPAGDLLPCDYCPLHTMGDIAVRNVLLLAPGLLMSLAVAVVGATIMPGGLGRLSLPSMGEFACGWVQCGKFRFACPSVAATPPASARVRGLVRARFLFNPLHHRGAIAFEFKGPAWLSIGGSIKLSN